MLRLANLLQTGDNSPSYWHVTSNMICCQSVNMFVLSMKNNGILTFLNTCNMVLLAANSTYLDSLNKYIVLCSYKALDLCERRGFLHSLVSYINLNIHF